MATLAGSDRDEGATVRQVADHLDLDRSTAQRRVGNLRVNGYLVNIEKKGQRGRYRVDYENVSVVQMLPTVEELIERVDEESDEEE